MENLAAATDTSAEPEILIVEDDRALSDQLAELLSGSGYSVDQCFDGDEALNLAVANKYSIILLDIMLPGQDGLSLLHILRSCNATPVIIVSARHAEEERIRGLSAGADDYLSKPFNSEELLLRIDAILRRTLKNDNHPQSLQILDGLATDSKLQKATVNERELSCTPIELGLLHTLIQNQGLVLAKPFLYQAVLNKTYSQYDRSLDMHMSRVRKKLHQAGWDGSRLQTVHGKGYCLR
ncbi:response regulator transcription factor [Lacimicrobium alkaliphilum]|uniref:DNA-binding response regulator n=1 Tax=Lacimicrobium alkaliphilum TaxID=1526571 RepID=A0ABQ1RAJ4_9ALTE|nr:response regulator transcription factor [Lacimicrobium alkaliphilum]GGD60787.1 DNA-binding response regulator [Lacimicrobium alkaliphilum]